MILFADVLWTGALGVLAGAMVGCFLAWWLERQARARLNAQQQSLMDQARCEAEAIRREARLAASEEALKQREQTEQSLAAHRQEMREAEQRLVQRESLINRQLEQLVQEEKSLRTQQADWQRQQQELEVQRRDLASLIQQRREQLHNLSQLSALQARELLLKEVEQEVSQDAGNLTRRILEEARNQAEEKARHVIGTAIQRYAGEHTFESTTATITLPSDEIKGRIIGREGRNIRAFENATGVTVLIDDTPNAVVLSAFDPIRREIARETMTRLILDGRIHPTRIEEVVHKVGTEMEEAILRHGEEAVARLGLPPFHVEILKLLGRLRYRQSFCQNLLEHSIEVAHLTALLAAELGLDVLTAKRIGLLHDIGKAVNQEIEGAHALVGAELLKHHGEPAVVVNAVAAHHGDVATDGPLGALVNAADTISASRPGARSETMTTYLKRVEDLERIGLSFAGVDKCFAVQAGRELRVLVLPDRLNDTQALALARHIARKIEEELQYPGQIRIVVLRETKCVEFAK